jgi:hypothetical protein
MILVAPQSHVATMAKKQKKVTSDDEDVIEITNKVGKTRIGKLPSIRDIQFVNSDDFDPKKLKLDDEEESGGISRVGLLYKYKGGERGLCLTCPKDMDAFFKCNGVEEETYAKKGGQRTGTGKNVMKLYFDVDNQHHERFYECLISICAVVRKKIEKETGKKTDVKIRGLYDIVDDDKNITGHAVSAKLIESSDGTVYTSAYNGEEQVDVKSIGRCVLRPALTFSYTIPEDGESYRISMSLTQVYYVPRSLFPLRDLD